MGNTTIIINGSNNHYQEMRSKLNKYFNDLPERLYNEDDLHIIERDFINIRAFTNDSLNYIYNAISAIQLAESAREKAMEYNDNNYKGIDDESE